MWSSLSSNNATKLSNDEAYLRSVMAAAKMSENSLVNLASYLATATAITSIAKYITSLSKQSTISSYSYIAIVS